MDSDLANIAVELFSNLNNVSRGKIVGGNVGECFSRKSSEVHSGVNSHRIKSLLSNIGSCIVVPF